MTTTLNSILVRDAEDDFVALTIANAMQSLPHVDVVSVVCRAARHADVMPDGITRPERWHVYAKYASGLMTPKRIDAAISAARAR